MLTRPQGLQVSRQLVEREVEPATEFETGVLHRAGMKEAELLVEKLRLRRADNQLPHEGEAHASTALICRIESACSA
jgi:hypothetical protein